MSESALASRGAAAGVVAATVWAAQQPLDIRVFGHPYSDTELLGRFAAPRGDGWRAPGYALHAANGALFGAVYALVARRVPGPGVAKGATAGLGEHLATWPLTRLVSRFHPARKRLPEMYGVRRAFWQSAWRHLLFGALLGALEERWRRGYADRAPG
jgi:hypothetical protein